MKIFRIVFLVFFIIILLIVGFAAWFCTGSFVYQNSLQEEFVIDEPISVVCKRAMNIKLKPRSKDKLAARIDMQQAAKNYSLGKPIEVEIDHPKLGTFKAEVRINLEAEPNSLKIRGTMVSLDPSQVKKYGKTVAGIENFTFVLKIAAKDPLGKNLGFVNLLTNTGKTAIELSTDSDIRVHFRGLGLLRSQIDRMAEKTRLDIVQEVENFLDENLRQPSEEELARQNAVDEKAPKSGNFWNRLKQGAKAAIQKVDPGLEPEKVIPSQDDDEPLDVSALDEEI